METSTVLLIVLGLVFLPHILVAAFIVLGIAALTVLAAVAFVCELLKAVVDAVTLAGRGIARIYREHFPRRRNAEPVEPDTFFVDDEPTEDERRKIREAFEKSFGLHAKKAATLDDLKPKFSTHEPEQAPTTIAEVSDIPLGLCSSPEAAIEKLRAIVAKITKSPVESLDVQTVGKFGGNFAYAGRAKLYDSTSRNETTAAKGEGRCEPEIEARR